MRATGKNKSISRRHHHYPPQTLLRPTIQRAAEAEKNSGFQVRTSVKWCTKPCIWHTFKRRLLLMRVFSFYCGFWRSF